MRCLVRHTVLFVMAGVTAGTAVWAALGPLGAGSREEVFVIPQGTWARRGAGEKLEVLPSEIRLMLGVKDVLVLRNQDEVPQMFGPVLIMPGQSFRLPFGVASSYQFACTAHVNGQLTVVVDPMPEAGWARLKWRAHEAVKSERWL